MTTFLTVEYAPGYGVHLQTARRLSESEKSSYLPEYQDYMMIGMGSSINLSNISWETFCEFLGDKYPDGEFPGGSNQAYIITQEQWDALIAMDKSEGEKKARQELETELADLEIAKTRAEKQMVNGVLPNREEAKKKAKHYNDVNNDGGEGYVPHFYCGEEYEYICDRINEIKGGLK